MLNNPHSRRILFFLVGCMGARFGLALLAKTLPPAYLPYMGVMALVIAAGFTIIYLGGLRPTGRETNGERIWWDSLRPVHAALWLVFGLMALRRKREAWWVLLADTLIGLAAFTAFHMGYAFQ